MKTPGLLLQVAVDIELLLGQIQQRLRAVLQVTVLARGFAHGGTVYRSLSAVAKAITGSHCNGYLFFRLAGKEAR